MIYGIILAAVGIMVYSQSKKEQYESLKHPTKHKSSKKKTKKDSKKKTKGAESKTRTHP